jgi:transcriptional regulator with XRE-family HTH domain
MKALAKPTELSGSASEEPSFETNDRAGARSALPFRLERLGECQSSRSEARHDASPPTGGRAASRCADAASGTGSGRHALNAVDTHVGARIRLRRHLLGISQGKLAKALGVTFQQIQKYERGLNRISASRLHDLACALDTSISFFFDDMSASIGETSAVPLGNRHAEGLNDPDLDRLHKRETLNLVRAYYNLEDPAVRRHILELVGSLASQH